MERYFVYILKSGLGYSYIGQTKNLEERLKRHNSNRSKYTSKKGIWEIVASKEVPTRAESIALEKKLKNFKNVEKAISYLQKLSSEHPDKSREGHLDSSW